ncbi:MAG: serine/threonine protein kinase [Ilumatobacteraceae bacterium]|nr:serine/threonine protein kinase [Ilumatobacteraceae bacterium]
MRHDVGEHVDHYEIIELLGHGAYAETYLARNTFDGALVVLKSPDPALLADAAVFQRYRRESQVVRSIDHPGVQRAIGGADDGSEPYLVLEYVDGVDLRKQIHAMGAPSGQLPEALAIDWGRQLAASLEYLHAHGIVHRDLKPDNVLVGADGRLKVADFGTALVDGAKRLTWKHVTEGVGTPDYMSPEQIQGERGDDRSDIYAWGVIMYEFLTGSVPFHGDNWMATMAGHLTMTPDRVRRRRPDVSAALEAVVMTAMRRYPEHRYQTVAALRDDLDRLEQLDPSTFDLGPEPPMGGFAAADPARRIWLVALGVAIGFVGCVAVVIGLSVLL